MISDCCFVADGSVCAEHLSARCDSVTCGEAAQSCGQLGSMVKSLLKLAYQWPTRGLNPAFNPHWV